MLVVDKETVASQLQSMLGSRMLPNVYKVIDSTKVCEICGASATSDLRLVRDHNHITNKIRGILCDPCNGRLGTFEHRLVSPRKCKGRFKKWFEQYHDKIVSYLSKSDSGVEYK